MIFTQQDPGHWLTFSKRADNINLPIQELTRKYNKEKLLFENYITNFQQMELASLAQQSAPWRQCIHYSIQAMIVMLWPSLC